MSGRVLEYALLPKSVPYWGVALHFVGGKELGWFSKAVWEPQS
jgi:hypothetical protein